MSFWENKSVLITGGTGSLGSAVVGELLTTDAGKIIVFSRGEFLQHQMRQKLDNKRLRFFIGDVRDKDRLLTAFDGIDVIVHTAALKQVSTGEYNPDEFVKTNVYGSQNVVEAAIERNVGRVIGISTDKAVHPVNLYGMTKGCMERLFVQGNVYTGRRRTILACVRYGNVVGSRGSVVGIFQEQMRKGEVTITDRSATRFWISLPQAVSFVLSSVEYMKGGEIFIPKLRAASVQTIYDAVDKDRRYSYTLTTTGLRNGEKMHEVLLSDGELDRAEDIGDRYVVTDRRSKKILPYVSNLVEQMSAKEVRTIIDSL